MGRKLEPFQPMKAYRICGSNNEFRGKKFSEYIQNIKKKTMKKMLIFVDILLYFVFFKEFYLFLLKDLLIA